MYFYKVWWDSSCRSTSTK